MKPNNLQALSAALIRMVRPLVRILLRNGVSYGTFSDLTKWMFVDVAKQEFGIKGRKQSTSRVAVITGAASGIGRAIADRAAQESMNVVLADIEESALVQTEAEMKTGGQPS
jgi:hypothetical protein